MINLKNNLYSKNIDIALESVLQLDKLKDSNILITGASGLIGSYIVDMLQRANCTKGLGVHIYALGRSKKRFSERFGTAIPEYLSLVEQDVNHKLEFSEQIDYIIHAASNAYPAIIDVDPVGTIMSNVMGTKNLLDYGREHGLKRFLFVSSGEIYGQGDLTLDSFCETYSGYIDPLRPRSCYPMSKRQAENLCCSYTKQYGIETVIARPCHTYGPSATKSDNRASTQFIFDALEGKDLVLKSPGKQLRSYCYITDCASALITILLNGKTGEAYNVANPQSTVTIREFAEIAADLVNKKVKFDFYDEVIGREQSPIEKQVLNAEKLIALGWKGKFSVEAGIEDALKILNSAV